MVQIKKLPWGLPSHIFREGGRVKKEGITSLFEPQKNWRNSPHPRIIAPGFVFRSSSRFPFRDASIRFPLRGATWRASNVGMLDKAETMQIQVYLSRKQGIFYHSQNYTFFTPY